MFLKYILAGGIALLATTGFAGSSKIMTLTVESTVDTLNVIDLNSALTGLPATLHPESPIEFLVDTKKQRQGQFTIIKNNKICVIEYRRRSNIDHTFSTTYRVRQSPDFPCDLDCTFTSESSNSHQRVKCN